MRRALSVGAALFVTALAFGARAQPGDLKGATESYESGAAFFAEQKYALALAQFKQSYATVPSPNSHLYMARCLAQLGEPVPAWREFDATITEAEARIAKEPKYVPTRDNAKLERDEVAKSIGLVVVDVERAEAGTRLLVAGADVPRDHWKQPVPVVPGEVEIVADTPNASPTRQTIAIGKGEQKRVAIAATPAPTTTASAPPVAPGPDRSNLRPYAYIAAGVGVAGLAVFTVSGLLSSAKYSDLSDSCHGPCPANRAGDVSTGKTEQTLANVGLVVGILGVGAGATLFVVSGGLRPGRPSPSARLEKRDGAAPATALVASPRWAGVRGTF